MALDRAKVVRRLVAELILSRIEPLDPYVLAQRVLDVVVDEIMKDAVHCSAEQLYLTSLDALKTVYDLVPLVELSTGSWRVAVQTIRVTRAGPRTEPSEGT